MRRTEHELPLFAWTPPACRMIPFPSSKRVGHARHVASILDRKDGRDATAYWRRICSDMQRQLERAGIDPDRRDRELRAFFDAVQAELDRMAVARRHNPTPGGSAA